MIKQSSNQRVAKPTAFPEPLAANRSQYQERGPEPQTVPDRPLGDRERRPTQSRNREVYQSDPDGIAKGARLEDPTDLKNAEADDDQESIAVTPDEAINAFGRRR